MKNNVSLILLKSLIDCLYFLETIENEDLEDDILGIMESISFELSEIDGEALAELNTNLNTILPDFNDKKREFVLEFLHGLER
jgi:hypothetical protein